MSRIIENNIAIGLGDLLYIKSQFLPFESQFDQIKLSFDKHTIDTYRRNDRAYATFLDQISKILFGNPPYILNAGQFPHRGQLGVCRDYHLPLTRTSLAHIMCRGYALQLNEEYVVVTTKNRSLLRNHFDRISSEYWQILKKIANKFKIVVCGEKIIEQSKEYRAYGANFVYSIYDEIIRNVPKDRLVDLTISALGITAPNVEQLQQDAMTMNNAKFVIQLGLGGSFCLSTTCAKMTIGYRNDNDGLANELFNNKIYDDAYITTNWDQFRHKIESYL